MDQIKIGKFIAERRKAENLTQNRLAEILGVTDRAVSKWENGRSMPDSSIMLELCQILKISVTELLKGEKISMKERDEKLEQTLLETIKQKEDADKRLLTIEIVLGVTLVCIMLAVCMIAAYAQIEDWLRITLIIIAIAPILIATPFMIKIEQTAGYYHCEKCGHKYVPKYKSVFMAMHMGRTRYMKCPKCEKRSWQKKVVSKED
ncbi:MAG: helix-turn-helix transcriptional regulator [Clostridia bacterium]|nr:helix-turn-helix transcriptional regulator [Clostridia bacterium]